MALIRLEFQLGEKINFIQRLENLLNNYERTLDKSQIYSELITYNLLVLSEVREACKYAEKLMSFGKIGDFVLVYFLVLLFVKLCEMVLAILIFVSLFSNVAQLELFALKVS